MTEVTTWLHDDDHMPSHWARFPCSDKNANGSYNVVIVHVHVMLERAYQL